MGRVEENKQLKLTSLMDTAFRLFTAQGIAKTSIADIAQQAGVAKGTFYLYFKDKYDLHEKLVIHKSEQLFRHALEEFGYQSRSDAAGKILAIIDDILHQLQDNKLLLQFISKNLSWGVFRRAISKWGPDYTAVFEEILGSDPADRQQRDITVYTVLELVGSTCYSVILNGDPVDLEHYLPYLHRAIRAILADFTR
ncbi:MAG: TetR/AcrR family transcriptional regulator [Oscillospiraceae bacterium]|nr:TetR/AcrR family transcriptional regulator [Oscillospiraceae bacterium]